MGYLWELEMSPPVDTLLRVIVRQNCKNRHDWCAKNDSWGVYGSGIADYDKIFESVLEGRVIEDLAKGRSTFVVIDLMSPSNALSELFGKIPQGEKFGLAVSLLDKRTTDVKQKDQSLGVEQIVGNITRRRTWTEIEKKLKDRKADLIMEVAGGALDLIPTNIGLYSFLIGNIWRIVSANNGVILLQTPDERELFRNGIQIFKWIDKLHRNGIDAMYESNNDAYLGSLMIVKDKRSPENLPLLK